MSGARTAARTARAAAAAAAGSRRRRSAGSALLRSPARGAQRRRRLARARSGGGRSPRQRSDRTVARSARAVQGVQGKPWTPPRRRCAPSSRRSLAPSPCSARSSAPAPAAPPPRTTPDAAGRRDGLRLPRRGAAHLGRRAHAALRRRLGDAHARRRRRRAHAAARVGVEPDHACVRRERSESDPGAEPRGHGHARRLYSGHRWAPSTPAGYGAGANATATASADPDFGYSGPFVTDAVARADGRQGVLRLAAGATRVAPARRRRRERRREVGEPGRFRVTVSLSHALAKPQKKDRVRVVAGEDNRAPPPSPSRTAPTASSSWT